MALSKFEGQDVVSAGIEIPNAAGGLRAPMRVDPREFHRGDKVTVVMDLRCEKVRFDPVKDVDHAVSRVHIMVAEEATFIDRDLVEAQLAEQRDRLRAAEEETTGQPPLPLEQR